MPGYTRIDNGIFDSTLWWSADPNAFRVFFFLIAKANSQGVYEGTIPGIAGQCRLSIENTREIIAYLESPEKDSRTQEYDGRRIQKIDGGWKLLNYWKYRQKDYSTQRNAERDLRLGGRSHHSKKHNDFIGATQGDERASTGDHETESESEFKIKSLREIVNIKCENTTIVAQGANDDGREETDTHDLATERPLESPDATPPSPSLLAAQNRLTQARRAAEIEALNIRQTQQKWKYRELAIKRIEEIHREETGHATRIMATDYRVDRQIHDVVEWALDESPDEWIGALSRSYRSYLQSGGKAGEAGYPLSWWAKEPAKFLVAKPKLTEEQVIEKRLSEAKRKAGIK